MGGAVGALPGDALVGMLLVTSVSNSRLTPPMVVTQWVWVSSLWVI
jgi:hypothetical protein